MKGEKLFDSKMYELVLADRQFSGVRRDELNKYYTSMFATILSVVPFVDKITKAVSDARSAQHTRLSFILLSLVGFILSISWMQTLKRLYYYIEATEKLLMSLEKEHGASFTTYIATYLSKSDAPDRITKQSMWVPYAFSVIFLVILTYTVVGYLV
jgi:hypothetical protein